jgi:hypothetical protein
LQDYTDNAFDDEEMLLSAIIADVEADKGREVVEHDDFKAFYHEGGWRKLGYTKRQLEDRIQKGAGRILGFESALRVLYTAQTAREQRYLGDTTTTEESH